LLLFAKSLLKFTGGIALVFVIYFFWKPIVEMSIIFIVIVIGLLFFLIRRKTNGADVVRLVKQSAKWATTAQQDESPLLATLHANYAVGYLWALKDIYSTDEISKKAGVNITQFEEHILNVQDMVTKKVIKKCPEFEGDVDFYLSTIAG
jgi:hypothetical protein